MTGSTVHSAHKNTMYPQRSFLNKVKAKDKGKQGNPGSPKNWPLNGGGLILK